MKRRKTSPPQDTRDLVFARDRHRCVWCGNSTQLQQHHRRPRGMGGTVRPDTNLPSNLLTLCEPCHRITELFRMDARDRGFLLPQTANPADEPVQWHNGQTVLLLDDGSVKDVTPSWP